MPKGSDMSYVARRPCGCVVAAYVMPAANDDLAYKRAVAKEVASWIRDGLKVETVTNDYVRANFTWTGCPICNPKHFAKQLPLKEKP
jgi:hypothetical protein